MVPNGLNGCRDHDLVPWPVPVPLRDVGYMRHFWRSNRPETFGLQAQRHHYAAGLSATGRRFAGHHDAAAAKDALFRARDWAGVTKIFEYEARSKALPSTGPRDELVSALAELRASLNSPVLLARPIANQLVDVWALVKQVDPEAARPAEALLCAMEGCDLVTAGQVRVACDQVEAALQRPASPVEGVAVPSERTEDTLKVATRRPNSHS